MRRFLVAAVASAAIGSLAVPGVSGAQSAAMDSVTGYAATGAGRLSVQFTFDARSGPAGENPTGTVSFDALLVDLGALQVSCLSVSGNRASMIVRIASPSPPAPAGVVISVEDNGAAAQDTLAWSFVTILPSECPVSSAAGEPILAGDITVTDAQPLDRHRARQACLFERAARGRRAFRAKYGRGRFHLHAMRRCIRQRIGG